MSRHVEIGAFRVLIFQRKSKWLWVQLALMLLSMILLACFLLLPTSNGERPLLFLINELSDMLLGDPIGEFVDQATSIFRNDPLEGITFILFVFGFLLHPFTFLMSYLLVLTRFVIFRRIFASLNSFYIAIVIFAMIAYIRGEADELLLYLFALITITVALWLPVHKEKLNVDAIIEEEKTKHA